MKENALIQASAGTGKTYALSGRFISLLLLGEDPSTILASTFTRKAAGEILERIYLRLARAVKDPKARAELAAQEGLPALNAGQIEGALKKLILNQHQLKVATLDAFASSVARLFAEELNLPQGWSIQDEATSRQQLSTAIGNVCSRLDSESVASLVTTLKQGETKRSISQSINSIVGGLLGIFQESGFAAWDWLKLAKPAESKKLELIEALRGAEVPKTKKGEPNITFTNAHLRIMALVEQESWAKVLAEGILQKAYNNETFSRVEIPESLKQALVQVANVAGAHCLHRLGEATRSAYGILFAVIKELSLLEESTGQVSFERISRRIVQLGKSLFSNELYFRLDTKLHHVLLDEFQDTSLLQWNLLEPLIEEKLSAPAIDSSFFCVGDGKQAIYGWRGGSTKIFDSIPLRWSQLPVESREKSYRSNPAIIELVNKIFASLENNSRFVDFAPAISNWLKRFKPHSSSTSGGESLINFFAIETAADSQQYGDLFFAKLKELAHNNAKIGILVRSNEEVSQLLDLAQVHNFELSTQGGTALTRFPVITTILALLSLTFNPGNAVKEFEVTASPFADSKPTALLVKETEDGLRKIGLSQTIQKLAGRQRHCFSDSEKKAVDHLISLAIKHEISNAGNEIQTFIRVVESSSVADVGSGNVEVLTIHKSKGLEFDTVVIFDASWELKPRKVPNFLLERDPQTLIPTKVSLFANEDIRIFSPELTAMHAAKRQEEFEEELSLLYVALTRAKSNLTIFAPKASLDSNSAAALISHSLEPQTLESVPVFESPKSPSVSLALKEEKAISLSPSSRKMRGLGRISPSSFIKFDAEIASNQKNELFGTHIHKLFAITKWAEEIKGSDELIAALVELGASESLSKEVVTAFKRYLALDVVRDLMTHSSKTSEVFLEKSFIYREGNSLIHGRMDRVVVDGSSGRIYDFKVGKNTADNNAKTDAYLKQLEIYKKAASILFPKVEFQASLIFLGDGSFIAV